MAAGPYSVAVSTGLIYAAGISSRFNADVGSTGRHKCLETLCGETLIARQVKFLVEILSVDRLVVVIGINHSQIIDALGQSWLGTSIEYVINDQPNQGNMRSLWVARNLILGNCFLTTSDLVLSETMIREFQENLVKDQVCWMGALIRQGTASDCVQMVIEQAVSRVADIGKFSSFKASALAGVGYYYFPKPCVGTLLDCVRKWTTDQQVFPSLYYAFREFLKHKDAYPIQVTGPWVDVDDLSDLKAAKQIFQ